MKSNLTICYEATQRVYRNAVVAHLRKAFTAAYKNDWKLKLQHTVGHEEWNTNLTKMRERQVSGEVSIEVADEFDLLSVNHFYNLFDIHFDVVFPPTTPETSSEKKKRRQNVLQWTRTVKSLRDPLSHPTEQDFSFDDAFVMILSAKRVLEAMKHPDVEKLQSLSAELSGFPKDLSEPLLHNLPPRDTVVLHFIGRYNELHTLWSWLNDTHMRRWALAGEGGKGKSAIAYEFATRVRFTAPEPFEIVLWLSAKKKRFRENELVPAIGPDFHDLSSALNKLLVDYGWKDETDKGLEERRGKVLHLLDEFPALIIVDDVDSLESAEESAVEFFTLAAPNTRSKVLLTSRRTLFGMGHTTTHITGLTKEDLREFVRSRCDLFGLDISLFTPERVEEIGQLTERSPLFIEDLLKLASAVSLQEAIKGWQGKEGHEARVYALGRELEMLSPDAKDSLLAASLSPGPVSFAELEALMGYPKPRLSAVISELQRLFLVPKPQLIEGEERFNVNVNTRALVVERMRDTDSFRRVENAVKAVGGRLPYNDRGRTAEVIRQAVFLVKTSEFGKAEETINMALKSSPNAPDLIGALGWVYKCWKPQRVTDARQQFARAAQLKCKRLDPYRHWIELEIHNYEWTNAAKAAEQGLKNIPGNPELLYWAGYSRSKLGRELLGGLVLERARAELEAASSYLEKLINFLNKPMTPREREISATAFRAVVLNLESLAELSELERVRNIPTRSTFGKTYNDYVAQINVHLTDWIAEHPTDSTANSVRQRLERKFNFTL